MRCLAMPFIMMVLLTCLGATAPSAPPSHTTTTSKTAYENSATSRDRKGADTVEGIKTAPLRSRLVRKTTFQTRSKQTATANPVDLGKRIGDIHIIHDEGKLFILLGSGAHPRRLTPAQYLAAVQKQQQRQSANHLFLVFNITGWAGVIWVALGLLGQVMFTGRMIVQWLVSEKQKRSVVPVAFWWMSLTGATMLLIYFVWRKDIVGVLGQSTGWAIYARNLRLIHARKPKPPAWNADQQATAMKAPPGPT